MLCKHSNSNSCQLHLTQTIVTMACKFTVNSAIRARLLQQSRLRELSCQLGDECLGTLGINLTRYILALDVYKDEPIHFLCPRWFGKSLPLRHFQGVLYMDAHISIYQVRDYIPNYLIY